MLCTNRKTDSVLLDTLIRQLGVIVLRMCGRCRMDNQRLHICNVCQKAEQLQMIDEVLGMSLITLEIKGKDGTAAVSADISCKVPAVPGPLMQPDG